MTLTFFNRLAVWQQCSLLPDYIDLFSRTGCNGCRVSRFLVHCRLASPWLTARSDSTALCSRTLHTNIDCRCWSTLASASSNPRLHASKPSRLISSLLSFTHSRWNKTHFYCLGRIVISSVCNGIRLSYLLWWLTVWEAWICEEI